MYRRIRLICGIIKPETRCLVNDSAHIIGFALVIENYHMLASLLQYGGILVYQMSFGMEGKQ